MIEDNIINKEANERTVLVGLVTLRQSEAKVKEYLDELDFLARTAGAEPEKRFIQKLEYPNPRTYVGKGKLEEIQAYIWKQILILREFHLRACCGSLRTFCEYVENQACAVKNLHSDRRIILDKISRLKEELRHIDRQKSIQRKNRGKLTRIALVGYTNVGKSTLMNLLSKSEVFAENKLFATLDTTVRKVIIDNLPFLLTDTVGFIRKLPTHLVDSFKSTLDEVREADILVHVVDISHPGFEEQIEVVNKTLQEVCGSAAKPVIMVFNKIDAFSYTPKDPDDLTPSTRENISLDEFRQTWMARMENNCVFISAKKRINIDALKDLLYQKAKEIHSERFPYNDFLFQKYDEDYDSEPTEH